MKLNIRTISAMTKSANAAKTSSPFIPSFPDGMLAHNSEIPLSQAYNLLVSICGGKPELCIRKEELADSLLKAAEKKFELRAYDGFEPSGRMHIAQGLLKTINVNRMARSGVHYIFLVADWHAQLNNKMGGDLKMIQKVGRYFVEIWKACGMDLSNVEFILSSEEINKRPEEYWTLVMEIARKNSVTRIKRCGQIMGRHKDKDAFGQRIKSLLSQIHQNRETDKNLSEEDFLAKYPAPEPTDETPVAQLLYPLMQCADIFFLKVNICQLGVDQQKVNVLAREFCDGGKKQRFRKPIIIPHPMLMGLKEGQEKMSKSNADSAVFMEDSVEDINRKLKKAFCRPGEVDNNPVLEYLRLIVFPWHEMKNDFGNGTDFFRFEVKRSEKNGGDVSFGSFEELKKAFGEEKLHPSDLKSAVARELNVLLEPVRKHFSSGKPKQLLAEIKKFQAK